MSVGRLLGHWSFSPEISTACLAMAAIYGMAARGTRGWPAHRGAAFLAGLAVIVVALESGIDGYDDRLLSAHMVQHLLLIDLAPALLIVGRPAELALRALPRGSRRRFGRRLVRISRGASPPVCLVAYSVIVLGCHVPVVFTAAVRHEGLHVLEHGAFLLAGTLMWWPLLGKPNPHRMGVIARIFYLTLAMVPMTLIGAYLDRAQTLLYPIYSAPSRALGVSPLADQQLAGAIMWVASTTFMALVGLASAMDAMLAAEARQRAREMHEVAS